MRTVYLFFNLYAYWLLICSSPMCLAVDTLKAGQNIIDNENETNLVSVGKIFELGFFSAGSQRYLGIWYHIQEQSQKQTLVWVANRDHPVAVDSTGVFQIAEDGNLVVVDTSSDNITYWSTNFSSNSSTKNRTLKLMDSGNLVLLDDRNLKLWQSFENPSDTFLPGMKMDRNLKLTSWKSADDPGSGNFTFKMEDNRFIILNRREIYWESEEYGMLNLRAKFDQLDDISSEVYNFLVNLKTRTSVLINTRLFIDSTGLIQWVNNFLEGDSPIWMQPRSKCLRYNVCGNFSSCNDDDYDSCKCLPGFYDDYSGDGDSSLQDKLRCVRRKSASCTGNDTVFLNLTMIKTGRPDQNFNVEYEENCTSICLGRCPQCQAYSYAPPSTDRQHASNCWIWTHNLTTLKEDYTYPWDDGRRLFVLVDKSDIEPTPRTCEPCGTNTVPYPLSTGINCGDLKYFNFRCNTSTGQLNFTTNNEVSYRVIRVLPSSRTFTIHNEDNSLNRNCGDGSNRTGNLKVSSPFHSDNSCNERVEVSWDPPSEEPVCDNSVDCHSWKNSTCSKGNRCLCNANYRWSGESLSCTESFLEPTSSPNATKESTKGNSKSSLALIIGLTTGLIILACIIIFAYVCRRRIARIVKKENEHIQRNIRGGFYDSERHVKDLIDMEGLEENDNEGIEVPYFDFESIVMATDDFSDANKLGRGGYGPVYYPHN